MMFSIKHPSPMNESLWSRNQILIGPLRYEDKKLYQVLFKTTI